MNFSKQCFFCMVIPFGKFRWRVLHSTAIFHSIFCLSILIPTSENEIAAAHTLLNDCEKIQFSNHGILHRIPSPHKQLLRVSKDFTITKLQMALSNVLSPRSKSYLIHFGILNVFRSWIKDKNLPWEYFVKCPPSGLQVLMFYFSLNVY